MFFFPICLTIWRVLLRNRPNFSSNKKLLIERDSPTRFSTTRFFHHSNRSGFRLWFHFRRDIWIFRISAHYDTWRSQAPRSIILRRVKFRSVSYCADSCDFSVSFLKGPSNEIFYLLFHNLCMTWPLSNGLKYFRFWSTFGRVIRVCLDWLRAIWYCAESVCLIVILNLKYLGEKEKNSKLF